MSINKTKFPKDFLWGAGSAAYQVEGAVNEDGRGKSIWDQFCTVPGSIIHGETANIACDHYHRYKEDVALMHELGIDAYRFSIAWPRILPQGRGDVNKAGLDFYDKLIDELLSKHIQPFITLYHWDLPQALEEEGGWVNRNTINAFVEYAEIVSSRFGDRVKNWITHNEPWSISWLGYERGQYAPGKKGEKNALAAAHHLLLSHGMAVPIIRRNSPGAQVGIALSLNPVLPATNNPLDAHAAFFKDGTGNRWFLDPIFSGEYPADVLKVVQKNMPIVEKDDLQTIATPIDFLGVNHYTVSRVQWVEGHGTIYVPYHQANYTDMNWEVYPNGLYEMLLRIDRLYKPKKIYITENGAAYPDVRLHDGTVYDPERQRYIENYIEACGRAIHDRVPLAGYFVWTLLDNFEWVYGYRKRFGIVYVDYTTLERIPKFSAHWYKDFIKKQKQL